LPKANGKDAAKVAGRELWPGMPAEAFDRLAAYIRALADQMGMKDWTYTLADLPVDDGDTVADCLVTYGMRDARIRVRKNFADLEPSSQRHVLPRAPPLLD
jgi:hypothetical protein